MYGWRGRIGLLIPANNTVIEPELNRAAPEGVSIYATRLLGSQSEMSVHNFHALEASFLRGARELEVCEVGVIAYACMGTTFMKPDPWARELADAVLDDVRIPATTASLALLDALAAVGARRIAVLTPYPPFVSQHIPGYFARHGLTVTAERHLDVSNVRRVGDMEPEAIYREAVRIDVDEADALAILATDWRTLEIVGPLRGDLGKPVITSNGAILARCLRALGLPDGLDAPA